MKEKNLNTHVEVSYVMDSLITISHNLQEIFITKFQSHNCKVDKKQLFSRLAVTQSVHKVMVLLCLLCVGLQNVYEINLK